MRQIPVIYARALYEEVATQGEGANTSFFGGALGTYKARLSMQADALAPQRWKEQAFIQELTKFYSRYPNQSWKNVVCIGDSIYERDAAKNVVLGETDGAVPTHRRLKTAKL